MIQLRARRTVHPIVAAVLFIAASAAHGKPAPLGPGPTVMSPEEIALKADPSRGVEHAAILLEEVMRVDDTKGTEITVHVRAKILSNEGREIANVKIDLLKGSMRLRKWWGHVIFPDDRVIDLPESALEEQTVVRSDERNVSAMTAALPGVQPGCVIDYGFVIRANVTPPYSSVPLRRDAPVLSLLYRWRPNRYVPASATLQGIDGLNVTSDWKNHELTVRGMALPRLTQEPLMPPDAQLRGALVLYYITFGLSFDSYWERLGDLLDEYMDSPRVMRSLNKMLAASGVSSRDGTEDQLRAVYDWIAHNITRSDLRSFEDLEQGTAEDEGGIDIPAKVMEARRANAFELSQVYVAAARALGATAHLVLVPDRTQNFVDLALKNLGQFDSVVVAVRASGSSDTSWTFVDAGSGLPFGEIPWFNSGVNGLLLADREPVQGARTHLVRLPVTELADSIAEIKGDVGFTPDNAALTAKWVFKGRGQVGLMERRSLRRASPEGRSQWLDGLCGASPEVDVRSAEVVNLEDVTHPFELRCDAELLDAQLSGDMERYDLDWASHAWVRPLPDLPPGPRQYAVFFDFPRGDMLYLNIATPAGFAAAEAPAQVHIQHEFGNYLLRVTKTDAGYYLERGFALFPLALTAERYEELRAFLEQVRRADATRLAFTRAR